MKKKIDKETKDLLKRIDKAIKDKDKLPKVKSKKKITYVDPPRGWRFGFPKALPDPAPKDFRKWLVDNGYPEEEVDFAMTITRWWQEEE